MLKRLREWFWREFIFLLMHNEMVYRVIYYDAIKNEGWRKHREAMQRGEHEQ